MAAKPSVSSIAKEIKLSRWLYGIFAVLTGGLAALSYFVAGRIEPGWLVAACVGVAAWTFADYFGKQLSALAESELERSNPPVNTDARDVPPPAEAEGARAGHRER